MTISPFGIMGTPVIDLNATPPRLDVASEDATRGWQVFALDLTNGHVLPGWPLDINDATLAAINRAVTLKLPDHLLVTFTSAVAQSARLSIVATAFERTLLCGVTRQRIM
jgi:hypothetical protein